MHPEVPITSRSNARVKALRASMSGHAAQAGDLLGLEGEHLIVEALRSELRVEAVFVRKGSEAVLQRSSLRALSSVQPIVLSPEVFASAVDTASPQGLAVVVRVPVVNAKPPSLAKAFVLIVEQLQDAGNLGTLLRTAEAFGFAQIFATTGTVNEWSPKVIRASAGSVFRVPVVRGHIEEISAQLSAERIPIFAAVAQQGGATALPHAVLCRPCAVMIGNEGAGLSNAALAIAHERVHIPCAVESLNAAVAGATVMYEAHRQTLLQERNVTIGRFCREPL